MTMDEMDAEFVMDIVTYQNISDGLGMMRKKRGLRFVGWKLIVPYVILSRGQVLDRQQNIQAGYQQKSVERVSQVHNSLFDDRD